MCTQILNSPCVDLITNNLWFATQVNTLGFLGFNVWTVHPPMSDTHSQSMPRSEKSFSACRMSRNTGATFSHGGLSLQSMADLGFKPKVFS